MPTMPMPGRSRQAKTKDHAASTKAAPQIQTSRSCCTCGGMRMDYVLRQEQAEAMSGIAYSSMRDLEDKGLFPARKKLPGARIGWSALEIQDWIAALPLARDAA